MVEGGLRNQLASEPWQEMDLRKGTGVKGLEHFLWLPQRARQSLQVQEYS